MVPRHLKTEFAKIIPIGKSIYSCAGNYVFEIKGSPKRLVKFFLDNQLNGLSAEECYEQIRYCARSKNPCVVKIHKYGKVNTQYGTYVYYVMDRLKHIEAREQDPIIEIIEGSLYGDRIPSYVSLKLRNFIKQTRRFKLAYGDLHGNNIMLTERGEFKFIDLESFQ